MSSALSFSAETDLYAPVKRLLEARGLVPKGEVRGCDVVATDPEAPDRLVVVELKRSVTLAALLQAADRFAVTEEVFLALPATAEDVGGRRLSPVHSGLRHLCGRLGLGLIAVWPCGTAQIVQEAGPPATERRGRAPRGGKPRPRNRLRAARIAREHAAREGDPTPGGLPGGVRQMTAYRQAALRCAALLATQAEGAGLSVEALRVGARAPDAARILFRNVYGWFEPAGKDLYRLTEHGRRAVAEAAASG